MIYSMTGFSVAQRELSAGTLTVELRAVNHRFLDLSVRLPEEFRAFEGAIREKVAGGVARGKVECRIGFNANAGSAGELKLDRQLLQALIDASRVAQELAPGTGDLKLGEMLRWPGVLTQTAPQPEELGEACLALLTGVLKDFSASRGREGEKLKAHLVERVQGMEAIVAEVKPRIPQLVVEYETKLKNRFLEALGTMDDDRVRQEIVVFAQKIDVDEELSRLTAHLEEVRRILDKGGAVGKRLDFLMQELNREANTLGSKSVSVETSRASMALKVLIEQMREQIQNLE
ncbi:MULTISPECIES: YicC/YloC family endoribonuclease [Silvimonas]|uniref:YicC/YloC family endoribonuclease n=1 Tax=Silvimonas TaxID=300264 RepID=UPI0024B396E5|nr:MULTISPECIES: YicC/YloC family endoribonuclease [Silvimonas]MDR3428799.1 YicC family protein [Silvimonas sp.]